jgi:hypothetical protein
MKLTITWVDKENTDWRVSTVETQTVGTLPVLRVILEDSGKTITINLNYIIAWSIEEGQHG